MRRINTDQNAVCSGGHCRVPRAMRAFDLDVIGLKALVDCLHRVVYRTGRERYSIPTFFNLDYAAPVSCLPSCQSADNPPKYKPIKSGDYLVSRFRDVQKYGTPIAA